MPPDTSRQLKLDLETSMENSLTALGCCGLLWAFWAGLPLLDGWQQYTRSDNPWYLLSAALLTGLGLGLRALVDEHYVLDLDERKLFFHRRWGSWKSVTPVASFEHFVAFAVQGTRKSSRSGSWWEYTPVLVTRDKRILRLADAGRDADGFAQAGEQARELAELTGSFHPPQAERILKVRAPGPTLVYVQHAINWPLIVFIIIAAVVAGLGIAWSSV